ncbi:hypothetical protein CFP56_015254 [Quercus suber]|uniref:Uncharacterized protein n=1 Tax=Quercus suber TaxID=58331 RepID=A0AAW0M2Z8_QUESU
MNPHALVVQKRTSGMPSLAAASRVKLMTPSETMQVTGGTWEEELLRLCGKFLQGQFLVSEVEALIAESEILLAQSMKLS